VTCSTPTATEEPLVRMLAETMAHEAWPTAHGGRWLANTCRRIALAEDAV
jgi:hypothetical protein